MLSVAGRLGRASAPALSEALSGSVGSPKRPLLIDFSGVDYVSSAGLDALCTVLLPFIADGATVAVCGLTEPVRLGLELAGLLERVHVSDTRQEAILGLIRNKS